MFEDEIVMNGWMGLGQRRLSLMDPTHGKLFHTILFIKATSFSMEFPWMLPNTPKMLCVPSSQFILPIFRGAPREGAALFHGGRSHPRIHSPKNSIRRSRNIPSVQSQCICKIGPHSSTGNFLQGGRPHEKLGVILLSIPGIAAGSLEGPQSVLEALAVLAAIITVHECGHFMAAYLQNIHVSKFAIGFGPTLLKFNIKNVECSLRAIPLGGYVGFPDNDQDSEFPVDDGDLLRNRPILDRVIVIIAGVVANIVFAYTILFAQVLTVGLLEQEPYPGVLVPEVFSASAAARDGIRSGDVVLGVDGRLFSAEEPAVFELVDLIKRSPGRKLTLLVRRSNPGEEQREVQVMPDANSDGTGRIGVQLARNAKLTRVRAGDLADATVRAGREFWRLWWGVVDGLKQILMDFSQTAGKVSGPVAIVAVGAEVARSSSEGLFQFAAVVNLNLAVVNLLPLPAFDGGNLALVALEAARGGKKLPQHVEQAIMSSGIAVIILLGGFLIVRDSLNLGSVRELL